MVSKDSLRNYHQTIEWPNASPTTLTPSDSIKSRYYKIWTELRVDVWVAHRLQRRPIACLLVLLNSAIRRITFTKFVLCLHFEVAASVTKYSPQPALSKAAWTASTQLDNTDLSQQWWRNAMHVWATRCTSLSLSLSFSLCHLYPRA